MKSLVLTLNLLLSQQEIPELNAFTGWKEKAHWSTEKSNVFELPTIGVNCIEKTLTPTHPQQTTKKYHYFLFGNFNHFKVSATSNVCRIKSGGPQSRCLSADQMEFALISDLYQDRCGNKYRGYWVTSFLKQDESMGTLFSKGKWTYSDPKSQFENDMKDGPTYVLNADEFLFLTTTLPEDEKEMSENLNRALKYTHDFDSQTLLFTDKK